MLTQPITSRRAVPEIKAFEYPVVDGPALPSWDAFGIAEVSDCGANGRPGDVFATARATPAAQAAAAREAHAEEVLRSFEAGRQRGFAQGQAAEREAGAASVNSDKARSIEQAARLVESLNARQARYFESVEREVVKLALAIAARILRREAQVDPLLLSGAVRVALGQLSACTEVRLRVPGSDLEMWRDTIAHLPNLAVKPALIGDDGLTPGGCALETEHGSVDLGIQSQLKEIERGFFDRIEAQDAGAAVVPVGEEMSE